MQKITNTLTYKRN